MYIVLELRSKDLSLVSITTLRDSQDCTDGLNVLWVAGKDESIVERAEFYRSWEIFGDWRRAVAVKPVPELKIFV